MKHLNIESPIQILDTTDTFNFDDDDRARLYGFNVSVMALGVNALLPKSRTTEAAAAVLVITDSSKRNLPVDHIDVLVARAKASTALLQAAQDINLKDDGVVISDEDRKHIVTLGETLVAIAPAYKSQMDRALEIVNKKNTISATTWRQIVALFAMTISPSVTTSTTAYGQFDYGLKALERVTASTKNPIEHLKTWARGFAARFSYANQAASARIVQICDEIVTAEGARSLQTKFEELSRQLESVATQIESSEIDAAYAEMIDEEIEQLNLAMAFVAKAYPSFKAAAVDVNVTTQDYRQMIRDGYITQQNLASYFRYMAAAFRMGTHKLVMAITVVTPAANRTSDSEAKSKGTKKAADRKVVVESELVSTGARHSDSGLGLPQATWTPGRTN